MRKGSHHKEGYRGTAEERFLKYTKKTEDCWEWIGTRCPKKLGSSLVYGVITANEKRVRAHRYSYEYHVGKIPEGLFVCHSCDNTLCVNPKHLFLGTNRDNVDDMVRKNRQTFGEKNPMSKLTDKDVMEIRKLHYENNNLDMIISKFGIAKSTASQIINHKRWTHI